MDWRPAVTLVAALGVGACGAPPPDDAPPRGTATAIPAGAPNATGVPIPGASAGAHAPLSVPSGDIPELPGTPPSPFAPEPTAPVPSPSPHPPSKKSSPKGFQL